MTFLKIMQLIITTHEVFSPCFAAIVATGKLQPGVFIIILPSSKRIFNIICCVTTGERETNSQLILDGQLLPTKVFLFLVQRKGGRPRPDEKRLRLVCF